jgi:hypothetical protein
MAALGFKPGFPIWPRLCDHHGLLSIYVNDKEVQIAATDGRRFPAATSSAGTRTCVGGKDMHCQMVSCGFLSMKQ